MITDLKFESNFLFSRLFISTTGLLIVLFLNSCARSPESQVGHPELEFFNSLSGVLKIELTEPPVKIGDLENERAKPGAKVKTLRFKVSIYQEKIEKFRDLTEEEYNSIAYNDSMIVLRSGHKPIEYKASNGKFFTVRDLINAVEMTERKSRGKSSWMGGVNIHHVFFEGLSFDERDGSWWINWGS